MINREIIKELIDVSNEYPVVTVLGPRQSGKTTLVKMAFPKHKYYSLEDPDVLLLVKSDPRGFFNNLTGKTIIDEVQNYSELLSYIQGIVDKSNIQGQFILTGSHQLDLHEAIAQSLAGRTSLLTLLPFAIEEISQYSNINNAFELILKGGFPRIYEKQMNINRFYSNYFQTYIERDVRKIINLKNLTQFQTFLRLLAGRVGQLINYSSLSNDIGASSTTIKNWISILQASFIVFELPPLHENLKKRLKKSSKMYFYDTGLVSYLLGLKTKDQVFRDPLRGGLFENFVIIEIMKFFLNSGIRPELFFYRDSHNVEVDLLIRNGNSILPVEIKSSSTFSPKFIESINKFKKTAEKYKVSPGLVICNIDKEVRFKDHHYINILNNSSLLHLHLKEYL